MTNLYHPLIGPDGKLATREDSQASAMGYAMENAYADLMAGITTLQSVGSPIDRDVREAINRGVLPGPRVLTSLRQITDTRLTPEQLREAIRQLKTEGADLVKRRTVELKETAAEAIERQKQNIQRHKDNLAAAVEAGKMAYRDSTNGPQAD